MIEKTHSKPTPHPQPAPLYLSAAGVCHAYQIGMRTVRRLQAQGVLKAYRIGPRLVRFKTDEVEQALIGDQDATDKC